MKKTYIVTVEKINNQNQKNRQNENIPIAVLSKKKSISRNISRNVEQLCFTLICFAHLSLLLTGVLDPSGPLGLAMSFFSLYISVCYSDRISSKLLGCLPNRA